MDFNLAGVSAFAFMGCLLVAGVVLRARVPFFQSALIPASLLGGLIGFLLMNVGVTFGFEPQDFTVFAFHLFTISFMSLCLTGSEQSAGEGKKPGFFGGSMWMAVVWTVSLTLQALIGLVVVLAMNGILSSEISPYLGIIVTHGFTQGPGQALAIGDLWQRGFAIQDAVQIGVIFASVGFLATFVIGVPIAKLILKGRAGQVGSDVLTGIIAPEHRTMASRHVTHPSNVETLAYHIGLLGLAYMVTYQYMLFMRGVTADIQMGAMPLSLFFSDSLFFVHGLIISLLIRVVIEKLGWGRYLDAPTQKVITGAAVDFMIIGTLLGIQFAVLETYIVLIVLVSVAVTAVTLALCFGFTDRSDPEGLKRSLTVFGCCCGSSGTGLLLLRLVDPHFETPIARELAIFNILIMLISAPITMVMAPTLPAFPMSVMLAVYGGTVILGSIYMMVAMRRKRHALAVQ